MWFSFLTLPLSSYSLNVKSYNYTILFCSNLSNNKITEIEDGTFEGASSVNELHLTANQIDSVRSGMFRGLEGLRML